MRYTVCCAQANVDVDHSSGAPFAESSSGTDGAPATRFVALPLRSRAGLADAVFVPIYLVRWPGLVAALVSADDEDDLMDILDETANPEGCTWSVYEGPICIEFALNASLAIDEPDHPRERPLDPDDVKLADVSRICDHDLMTAEIPAFSDTAADMVDAIVSAAFPALKRVVDGGEEPLPEDKVRMALRDELDALVKASWRHEQTKRRADPESRMAAHLGTSPRLIAHWNKRARTRPAPKKPKRPTGKRKLKKPK